MVVDDPVEPVAFGVLVAPGAVVVDEVGSGASVEDVVVVDGMPVARGVVSLLPQAATARASSRTAASRFTGRQRRGPTGHVRQSGARRCGTVVAVDDEIPVYGTEDEPEPPVVLRVRDVLDLVVEMTLLGALFGVVLAARSNYVKLLLIPLAIPAWSILRRVLRLCWRILTA